METIFECIALVILHILLSFPRGKKMLKKILYFSTLFLLDITFFKHQNEVFFLFSYQVYGKKNHYIFFILINRDIYLQYKVLFPNN